MKYLCLVYGEEKALDALSKREMEILVDESLAYEYGAPASRRPAAPSPRQAPERGTDDGPPAGVG